MSFIISFLNGLDQAYRVGTTTCDAVRLIRKITSYDIRAWSKKDYIDVSSRAGVIMLTYMEMKYKWDIGTLKNKLEQGLLLESDAQKILEECANLAERLKLNNRQLLACTIAKNLNESKSLYTILTNREVLGQLQSIADDENYICVAIVLRIIKHFI